LDLQQRNIETVPPWRQGDGERDQGALACVAKALSYISKVYILRRSFIGRRRSNRFIVLARPKRGKIIHRFGTKQEFGR